MTRISILTGEEMDDEQRAVIDASVASGKPHSGPFWAYIRTPKLMQIVQDMASPFTEKGMSQFNLSNYR